MRVLIEDPEAVLNMDPETIRQETLEYIRRIERERLDSAIARTEHVETLLTINLIGTVLVVLVAWLLRSKGTA